MYRAPQIAPDQRRGYVSPPSPEVPPRLRVTPEEVEYEYDSEQELPDEPPDEPPAKRPRRQRSFCWRLFRWGLMLAIWGVICLAGVLVYFAADLPRPEAALDAQRRPSLTLTDTDGRTIATYGDVVGEPMRLTDLPKYLPEAAVSVEDRRFWTHFGIDPRGIARAIFVNFTRGKLSQGGSTITQQVAKNLFLTNQRTLKRKVQEVMLTVWLERSFSKAEILEIWLNRVYLGAGTWGVDAAAHMYFGVSARDLNLWQSAVIAGLPRAPSRYSPRVDPKAAAMRGRQVLQAMADNGVISQQDADLASASIVFQPRPANASSYFADWAADRAQAAVPVGQDAAVKTTLDSRLQAIAEAKLASILDVLGGPANVSQGAVVVMDPASGAVRAMVGGRDYRQSPYNRAVVARRQPGSSFKLFVWLNALEHGMRPDDLVADGPIRVGNWSPRNFEPGFHGQVTLEDGLAESMNTVSVRLLLMSGGPKAVAACAARLGIADTIPDNATIALGTADVGLLEMATAYAEVFNGGVRVVPRALDSVEADGRPVQLQNPDIWRVVDPQESAQMTQMLQAVVSHGTGRAANIAGHVVAGKTGTTSDYRDAWFIGAIDPGQRGSLLIAVWLGNDDGKLMKDITGGTLPAKLFHEIAAEAVR